jgi:tetratricopeptide (TPR) repeat protein
MNQAKQRVRRFSHRIGIGLLGAALLLAAAGCMTQQQIQKIVDDSNAQLLAGQFAEPQLLPTPGKPEADDVAKRIEDFIAAHPDQKTLDGSLRVRQAIVYLNRKDYDLADAAFKAARELAPLPTARDDALVAVHESLIWWYENSGSREFDEEQIRRAAEVRGAFNDQAKQRAGSPDIRDFLAEAGAWVGLQQATSVREAAEEKLVIEQSLNAYAGIFDAEDLKWLCHPAQMADKLAMSAVRRRVRAETVLNETAKVVQGMQAQNRPTFEQPVFQELVAPTSQAATCERRFPKKN